MNDKQFGNVLAKAQSLMLDEGFNARVEAAARAHRGGGTISDSEIAMFEQQAFGGQSKNVKAVQRLEQADYESNLSKLPDAIRESFVKLPPQSDKTPISSVVEKLSKNLIQEEKVHTPVSIPQTGVVDYSLIKLIVKECVKESLAEMKGSMLTESSSPSFRGMRIADGNKFQFIDSKGNLYEGVLKLKKKA